MKLVALCSRATWAIRCCNSAGQWHRRRGAALIGDRRVGPVRRQLQALGHPGQRVLPVGQLPGDQAVPVVEVAELRALPQRVIDVLHRQFGPDRRLAPRTG